VLIKSFENPNLAARYARLFLHETLWLFSSSTARAEYGLVDAVEVTAARYPARGLVYKIGGLSARDARRTTNLASLATRSHLPNRRLSLAW
jgi:hypothetical protein